MATPLAVSYRQSGAGDSMRFIEYWFGIWPDAGDGSLELLVLELVA